MNGGDKLLTEHKIEAEWEVAKLLITNMWSYKMLLFKLPQYGLYLQSLRPIPPVLPRNPGVKIYFEDPDMPHIAAVRTQEIGNVARFIQDEKRFEASRIFKHGLHFQTLEPFRLMGLVCNTVKNMMALKPGKVFRIKSTDKQLRNVFYRKAVTINEEDNFGCSFDYDIYDYTLEIRRYKRFLEGKFHCWAIVTILYGRDLPNSWNMETTI